MTNQEIVSKNAEESSTRSTIEKFNAAFNQHDVDAVMNLMTLNCLFESTNPPPDGLRVEGALEMRVFWKKFFDGNPDAFFETEEMLVTANRCIVRWIYRKTKDGNPWYLRGVDIFKVENGKVAEKLAYVKG